MENNVTTRARAHEDAALKVSMQYFATELLPYFGIEGKVVSVAPTELVELEIHKLFQDYTLVMEDGTWKHFEFQSTNEGILGLKRFRTYEAIASYQYDVEITTYVLYSGKIKNPVSEFTEGINTYRIHPIIMTKDNADELFQRFEGKIRNNEPFYKEDLVPLMLCLLMAGESSLKDRVKKAFEITRASNDIPTIDIEKIEAVIYTMAEKFLDNVEIEEVREIVKMTKLGQMLVEDGRIEGREEGREEGRVEGEKRLGLLMKKLLENNCQEDLLRVTTDAEHRNKLYKKYNL